MDENEQHAPALPPEREAELKRRAEERQAQAEVRRAEEEALMIRLRALEAAAQWCGGENWKGHAGHVVGAAQVFEQYLKDGKLPTRTALTRTQQGHRA